MATLTFLIIGSVLTILMFNHCKKRSAGMSLRLAKNSGKAMKTSVYNAVAVYSWDSNDVTLENASSSQQYEEDPMILERVKKPQVPKEDVRSSITVFKISHLY